LLRALLEVDVFFFQAEDGIRDRNVTGVQTCALPICNVPVTNPAGELARLNAFHGRGEIIDNVNAHSNAGGTGFHACFNIIKATVDDKRHEVILQLFQNTRVCVDIVTHQGKARDLIVVDGGIGNLSHVCGIRVSSQNNTCVNGVPVDGGGG